MIFTGFVPEDEYLALLQGADAIIDLTTREDCLVCGGYEGVAVERPLILSDTAAIRSYFSDGVRYTDNSADDLEARDHRGLASANSRRDAIRRLKQRLIADWDDRRTQAMPRSTDMRSAVSERSGKPVNKASLAAPSIPDAAGQPAGAVRLQQSTPALTAARRDALTRRYEAAEWRAEIFADVIIDEIRGLGNQCAVVGIGCGGGFDGSIELQQKIAAAAATYIGVEPDPATQTAPHFDTVHRCLFEAAPIAPASVDVAFGVMVVEHVTEPHAFMSQLARALKPGGVFWAFTVDLRHWSAWSSLLLEKTGLKVSTSMRWTGQTRRGSVIRTSRCIHLQHTAPGPSARLGFRRVRRNQPRSYRRRAQSARPLRPLNHAFDHPAPRRWSARLESRLPTGALSARTGMLRPGRALHGPQRAERDRPDRCSGSIFACSR